MEFMEFMFKLFDGLPRQGPGDYASTRKAFLMLKDLPKKPSILDVGCGTGMQSTNLAKLAKGKVIAIDINQGFLDTLNERAEDLGISHRIKTLKCSMDAMNFDKNMLVMPILL